MSPPEANCPPSPDTSTTRVSPGVRFSSSNEACSARHMRDDIALSLAGLASVTRAIPSASPR
jgi:hypothetical protein